MNIVALLALIRIMDDALEPENWIAHVVLGDENLSDSTIDFAIQYAKDNAQDFIQHHPGATLERIHLVVRFLYWLKAIPQELRDELMEHYHS